MKKEAIVFLGGFAIAIIIGLIIGKGHPPYAVNAVIYYLIFGGIAFIIFRGINKISKNKSISIGISISIVIILVLLIFFIMNVGSVLPQEQSIPNNPILKYEDAENWCRHYNVSWEGKGAYSYEECIDLFLEAKMSLVKPKPFSLTLENNNP